MKAYLIGALAGSLVSLTAAGIAIRSEAKEIRNGFESCAKPFNDNPSFETLAKAQECVEPYSKRAERLAGILFGS